MEKMIIVEPDIGRDRTLERSTRRKSSVTVLSKNILFSSLGVA